MRHKSYFFYFFLVLLPFCSIGQQDSTANFGQGSTDIEIKSILMKRSGCFGTCPIYNVKFSVDGTAEYNGIRFVDQKGKYCGKIRIWSYRKLSDFINKIDFKKLNEQYRVGVTDLPSVTVIVTYKNGNQKKVYSYGFSAPIEFWGLTKVIDAVKNEIDWKKKE